MTVGYWPEHCTREVGPILPHIQRQEHCGFPIQTVGLVGTEMLGYCTQCRTAYILQEQPIEEND